MRAAKRLREKDTSSADSKSGIASILNRLASPDFPAELLLQVVETAVVSQVGHWKVTDSHKLSALVKSLFARPKGVTAATRTLLRQTAETALLKLCIIMIPADLDERRPPKYEIPPALIGRETHVKHLVLDLDIHVGDRFNTELSVSTGHMDLLAETFPRLAVCTYLLHIEYDPRVVPTGGYIDVSILGHQTWRLEKSTTPFAASRFVRCTVEDNLVDFIDAFARSGPGRRKLIRFSRRNIQFPPWVRPTFPREYRPLVRVMKSDRLSRAGIAGDALVDDDKESIINAGRILGEAYCGEWKHR